MMSIDEQEINQETYVHNGELHGLTEKISPSKLKEIGLDKLPSFKTLEAPFISAVREYRLMDLDGIFCSNVYTSFIPGAINSEYCSLLKKILKLATSCTNCLKCDIDCEYSDITQQCSSCKKKWYMLC